MKEKGVFEKHQPQNLPETTRQSRDLVWSVGLVFLFIFNNIFYRLRNHQYKNIVNIIVNHNIKLLFLGTLFLSLFIF